jgi:hypothetical protein
VLPAVLIRLWDWFKPLKATSLHEQYRSLKSKFITFTNTFIMLLIVVFLMTSSTVGLNVDSTLDIVAAVRHKLNSGSVYLLRAQGPGEY